MKLSEAIRVGSQLRPKAVGILFDRDARGTFCSCALGAAYEAVTGPFTGNLTEAMLHLPRLFPLADMVMCPLTGEIQTVQATMTYLNDDAKWSRERIADWLASIGY